MFHFISALVKHTNFLGVSQSNLSEKCPAFSSFVVGASPWGVDIKMIWGILPMPQSPECLYEF